MSRAIDDGQPVHAELPLSTQAGGRIWTQMSLTPVMSETEPAVVENHVSALAAKVLMGSSPQCMSHATCQI